MRILVVEDDRQLRASLARGLQEAGYDVEEAASGRSGLARALRDDWHCLVLDVLLPGLDGLQVCRALREAGDWTPVLMLTALDAVEDRIGGLDAGADDYLAKPFDFGELLARVRALTRRRGEAETEVRVGELTIDTARKRARRGDRALDLTAREYEFLLHLARNAGRVVSRAELMEHVWGGSTAHSNVIDVYASRIRRKLDEGEDYALFTTHRGTGYILTGPEHG